MPGTRNFMVSALMCSLIVFFTTMTNTNALSIHPSHPQVAANNNKNNLPTRRSFLHTATTTAASFALIATPKSSVASTASPIRFGDEDIMSPKAHGTTQTPVQESLKFGVSNKLADKICCYNRHFAENSFSFTKSTWEDELRQAVADNGGKPMTFYDSVTGKPLFMAPIGRSVDTLIDESYKHGWPSFRDAEVVWDNVRVLKNSGETVSVDGTHLGHNLPDRMGNRYCINLCCIAGYPA